MLFVNFFRLIGEIYHYRIGSVNMIEIYVNTSNVPKSLQYIKIMTFGIARFVIVFVQRNGINRKCKSSLIL